MIRSWITFQIISLSLMSHPIMISSYQNDFVAFFIQRIHKATEICAKLSNALAEKNAKPYPCVGQWMEPFVESELHVSRENAYIWKQIQTFKNVCKIRVYGFLKMHKILIDNLLSRIITEAIQIFAVRILSLNGKSVEQSNIQNGHKAELAIDGNNETWSQTFSDSLDFIGWWKVNLGKNYMVAGLTLTSPTSHCGEYVISLTFNWFFYNSLQYNG